MFQSSDLVGEVGNSTFVSDFVSDLDLKFFDFPTKFLFIHWIDKALKVYLASSIWCINSETRSLILCCGKRQVSERILEFPFFQSGIFQN
jgi:hypothetical protein